MIDEDMTNQETGLFNNWKKRYFWSYFFQFTTFIQVLDDSFHHRLAIPVNFIKTLGHKLQGIVKIKSRSGACWYVDWMLSVEGEAFFQGNEWIKLVKDNSLGTGDILTFNYEGNLQFDLLVYNPKTNCEKDASFFVRKSVPTKKRSKRVTKKNTRLHFWFFGRRSATEEEREIVKQKAVLAQQYAAESNQECFIAIMRPSYVYSRYFMCIPYYWLNKNIPRDVMDIILRVGEKKWSTGLQLRVNASGGYTGGLSKGWKHFVRENSLEEDDVCVFQLGENVGGQIFLDVGIFRVI